MSGSVSAANPFDEWNKHQIEGDAITDPQLELMRQARPSVYNLPNNPMNQKSYKCNYIKARVETTRMDFI